MKILKKQYKEDLVMSQAVYQALEEFIGEYPAERGAMLGRDKDGVVRHTAWDTGAICNGAAYSPDTDTLNKVIKDWTSNDIEFIGFVHSHPNGVTRPSMADVYYSSDILGCFKSLEHMWLPIIQTKPNSGEFEIIPYVAVPNKARTSCKVYPTKLTVEADSKKTSTIMKNPKDELSQKASKDTLEVAVEYEAEAEENLIGLLATNPDNLNTSKTQGKFPPIDVISKAGEKALKIAKKQYKSYFQRQENDFDLKLLADTRLVIIGTGGAASLVESCARMGYGEFVLIDPDTISESNVATQMVNPDDIGKYKVDALARKIIAINPLAVVQTIPKKIEALDDDRVNTLLTEPLQFEEMETPYWLIEKQPKQTILMVLTDNFEAQARGHRIGLNAGISTICAQAYTKGMGAEITYTVPDVTEACHRCITSSRYRSYLKEGYKNDVASAGSPIFAAEYLNASIGHVLLAVTHHGTEHPTWGNVINKRGNRNLLMIKMNPSFADTLGFDLVANAAVGSNDSDAFSMLTAVSLPQTPDQGQTEKRPTCPDCGGTGDLQSKKGSIADTTEMKVA